MTTPPKIGLSPKCVQSLLHSDDNLVNAREEARTALAEHEAKQNPLGLPWTLGGPELRYAICDSGGKTLIDSVFAKAEQVRLMAAAPKLAECLEQLVRVFGYMQSARYDFEVALVSATEILQESGYRKAGGSGE